MPQSPVFLHVYGPFDGDFDPFEDEDEGGPLITFGRVGRLPRHGEATAIHGPGVTGRRRPS